MGAQISALYYALKEIINDYRVLSKRISLSPGIPELNSSLPFWTIPNSPIARHGADKELPQDADVVIIGSGISGTAVARTLLELHLQKHEHHTGSKIKVVMLEARDACSGATGRNGGHACPNVYNEYAELKAAHGPEAAVDILRFRLAHIEALIEVAKEENILEASQVRIVDDFDAFLHPDRLKDAKDELRQFLKEVPKDMSQGFEILEGPEAVEKLQLSPSIQGCIVKPGASMHGYRFVTGILSNLLSRHSNFHLFTRTPCTSIRVDGGVYLASTPRGDIRAQHIVHTTNAWSSHLLPGMRRKIVPLRAHMSAQRPGQGLMPSRNPCGVLHKEPTQDSHWAGSRAFVFYPSSDASAYDYLTQLLPSKPSVSAALPTAGEFMYGGGMSLAGASESTFLGNIGVADDNSPHFPTECYLAGSLAQYFGAHWGAEGNGLDTEAGSPDPETGRSWGTGRVKAIWTGIIGLSADMQPWVGRVPKIASGRQEPQISKSMPERQCVAPGEWISAGFTGEGMVHAWLTGKALARMILGEQRPSRMPSKFSAIDSDWETEDGIEDLELPTPFLITKERVKKANIEDLMSQSRL